MAWKVAYRPRESMLNSGFESWSGPGLPRGGWSADTWFSMSHVPYSDAGTAPLPWMGRSCVQGYSWFNASERDMATIRLSTSHYPLLQRDGNHRVRVSMRVMPQNIASSGNGLRLYVGSTVLDSGAIGLIGDSMSQAGFPFPLTNSWQLCEVAERTWTGSSQITVAIRAHANFAINNAFVSLDDFRVMLDEIELPRHQGEKAFFENYQRLQRGETGRSFTLNEGQLRAWRLPLDHLPSSQWELIEDWYADGGRVYLTAPGGTVYPAIMVGRKSPIRSVVEAYPDRRAGLLEIEADYSRPINGPVWGEPLP